MRRWGVHLVARLLTLGLAVGVSAESAIAPSGAPQAGTAQAGLSQTAVDMAEYYQLIYQIRVVARKAGSKSSIGSGFQVSADGLIATNFHVVASAVDSPETHRIEYLDQNGNSGELTLLDFDVINDLAILRHPDPAARFFPIASREVKKGEMIYALGNPHDLGITLKLGAFNGMVEHSYNPQILFSGSLNPGMSGGPGLLADGSIVGVNVATAGSDLSFLVPADQLQKLISADRSLGTEDYEPELAAQVQTWQTGRYDDLLARDWPVVAFGDWPALDEIRNDMQCWGRSNEDDEEATVVEVRKGCDAGNRVYLGDGYGTGQIHYSFSQRKSISLPALRFHASAGSSMFPDNAGDDTRLTGFDCQSEFVRLAADDQSSPVKTSLCTRGYVEMPGLFDVLMLATQSSDIETYTAHFALAGVSQSAAQAFTEKFFASLGWK